MDLVVHPPAVLMHLLMASRADRLAGVQKECLAGKWVPCLMVMRERLRAVLRVGS